MSEQLSLYSGYVTKVETTRDWLLIHTKGNRKPVGFNLSSFVGDWPSLGDKITVEASEGNAWFFGHHRTLVLVKQEPSFPVEGLPNSVPDRNAMVASLIMDWLSKNQQVCSDDIYDEAVKRAGGKADPRFIGHGFRILSKEKKIHKVGYKNSERIGVNHGRPIVVWELTLK